MIINKFTDEPHILQEKVVKMHQNDDAVMHQVVKQHICTKDDPEPTVIVEMYKRKDNA